MSHLLPILLVAFLLCATATCPAADATRIARWKDDKKAAFVLMFDDSIPSHVKNAVPEMQKRGLTGTFYVNPGRPFWNADLQAWEKTIPAAGMAYGNHTFTHQGFANLEEAEVEFAKCNEVIDRCFPSGGKLRLLSFAKPGGLKEGRWEVTPEQEKQLMRKYHLVDRPPFGGHGAAVNVKTADEMMGLANTAITKSEMGYIVFHGVGGEWISADLPAFTAFLDKLVGKRDQLWITDHIRAHKYETERASASATTTAGADEIRVELTCGADVQLYDEPLTLITSVSANWQQCTITQGEKTQTVSAKNGTVAYDAVPNGQPIVIRPAK